MDNYKFSKHIALNKISIKDDFWSSKLELVRKEVIPYQYKALNDMIEGADKSYCIENFIKADKIAKQIRNGEAVPTYPVDKWCYDLNNSNENAFHGWVFQDSDVYKWIEAVGYSLLNYPDEGLEKKAKECIDIICKAQLDNGYLDTLYIINNPNEIFSNLKDFHELYCFGHLTEGAISFYNATGDDKLLNVAIKFADLICDTFGKDKIKGYPGHEIAEMALVKLYDLTNNKKYLDMAEFFIDERGKKPYYYDIVLGKKTVNDNYHYNQAHIQPRLQKEAVGHAVRGVYLYSGMADVAKRCNDSGLYSACVDLMDNIINKKMYITGGIGANVDGESFSFNYDLPNDLAYSETCASIGLIFFARRMLEIQPNSQYADTVERALYNTVLSGMAQDGKSFFYVNPLEVLPEASHKDSRKRHIKPVRQKWFSCACCPPNLARLISSLGEYCFTENDDCIYIHQYIGADIKAENAQISIRSNYVTDGRVKINISPKSSTRLALRIPGWADKHSISVPAEIIDGYAYINVDKDMEIIAEFELKPRLVRCSNRVRANVGRAAVMRGPLVYCVEEVDNGKNLQMLSIDDSPDFKVNGENIVVNGYREKEDRQLYSTYYQPIKNPVKITFIPYYKWGNRGENEMSVYIRIQ
ncbi:MAG: glycoside hydrolase family 127 protein [Eubacterium sp.]